MAARLPVVGPAAPLGLSCCSLWQRQAVSQAWELLRCLKRGKELEKKCTECIFCGFHVDVSELRAGQAGVNHCCGYCSTGD